MPKCIYISLYKSFDIAPNILYIILFVVNCSDTNLFFLTAVSPTTPHRCSVTFIGYECHSGSSSNSLCSFSTACMVWLRYTLHANCAVWQTWTVVVDFVPLRRSSCTFHRRVASPSATTLSQSQQLAFGTVCHLTSSRRHRFQTTAEDTTQPLA